MLQEELSEAYMTDSGFVFGDILGAASSGVVMLSLTKRMTESIV